MVRIFPYAAVQFMSFEGYKRILENMFVKDTQKVNHELKFVAGSLAGVSAVAVTYPLDLTRARLASVVTTRAAAPSVAFATTNEAVFVPNGTPKAPTSILGTIMHVFKYENGMRGLYRGITPTILAMIPYGGCNFYIFERLKYFCVHYAPDVCCKHNPGSDKSVLNVPSKLLCGGVAGAIGQTAIFPLDVARRRMQLAMTSSETAIYSQSFVRTLMITYQKHGIVKGKTKDLNQFESNLILSFSLRTLPWYECQLCSCCSHGGRLILYI